MLKIKGRIVLGKLILEVVMWHPNLIGYTSYVQCSNKYNKYLYLRIILLKSRRLHEVSRKALENSVVDLLPLGTFLELAHL